jgi:hypothetical protein
LYNFCPTCYASNYKESNDIANRNLQHCNFNKARALACSFLQAKKILARVNPSIVTKEDYSKIESIIQIQNQITIQHFKEIFVDSIFQLSELEIVKLANIKSNGTETESLSLT